MLRCVGPKRARVRVGEVDQSLHAGGVSHLLRETMNNLESRLDPECFWRIHRSTLVNVERIRELQPLFHGDYVVILRDGTELTLSRTYRRQLPGLFGEAL